MQLAPVSTPYQQSQVHSVYIFSIRDKIVLKTCVLFELFVLDSFSLEILQIESTFSSHEKKPFKNLMVKHTSILNTLFCHHTNTVNTGLCGYEGRQTKGHLSLMRFSCWFISKKTLEIAVESQRPSIQIVLGSGQDNEYDRML